MYLLRLDDASEYMDLSKWSRMEAILDQYEIKPIVGVIPDNRDPCLLVQYQKINDFWQIVERWKRKNWSIALHGYQHKYTTRCSGVHPVNDYSEFAGVELEKQKLMIKNAVKILKVHNIEPDIFFAPAHTFDKNTLKALKAESNIRIISDTIAWQSYFEDDFYFIPQQSGSVRKLPFKITTFCYHPNTMSESAFDELETFIHKNKNLFGNIDGIELKQREKSLIDKLFNELYFFYRKVKKRR